MPTTIDEDALTPAAGVPIEVPVGADNRTASSLMTAWNAIAARLKFLEQRIAPFFSLDAGDLAFDASAQDIKIVGDGPSNTHGLFFENGAGLYPGGNCFGALFRAGEPGVANRKTLTIAPAGASTTNVDASIYDEVWVTSGGNCSIVISNSPAYPYVAGHHITVHAKVNYDVVVKNPAGSTILAVKDAVGSFRSMTAVYDGSVWQRGHCSPASSA